MADFAGTAAKQGPHSVSPRPIFIMFITMKWSHVDPGHPLVQHVDVQNLWFLAAPRRAAPEGFRYSGER